MARIRSSEASDTAYHKSYLHKTYWLDATQQLWKTPQTQIPTAWYHLLGTRLLVPISWYQNLGTNILVPGSWYQDMNQWQHKLSTNLFASRTWYQDTKFSTARQVKPSNAASFISQFITWDCMKLLVNALRDQVAHKSDPPHLEVKVSVVPENSEFGWLCLEGHQIYSPLACRKHSPPCQKYLCTINVTARTPREGDESTWYARILLSAEWKHLEKWAASMEKSWADISKTQRR